MPCNGTVVTGPPRHDGQKRVYDTAPRRTNAAAACNASGGAADREHNLEPIRVPARVVGGDGVVGAGVDGGREVLR